MGRLFGTDGVRGRANQYPMTPEMAQKLGKAVAHIMRKRKEGQGIVIGRDTRISGSMLENAFVSGVTSQGVDALVAGVLPTPAVALLTAKKNALAGVVISASHNPYFDNGIKVFNGSGFKLSIDLETTIEDLVLGSNPIDNGIADDRIGRVFPIENALDSYLNFLKITAFNGTSLSVLKIVLDCSNGATHAIAPLLFKDLGAGVEVISANPDGININENCGSEHTGNLSEKVIETKADIGLAFDGDGDRLIVVDEKGQKITGDQILSIFSHHLKCRGALKNNICVSTVMSNMGLGVSLERMGIEHRITKVGDRHVMEEMRSINACLGGEDSGHIIFLDRHTTGDGILAGLRLCEIVAGNKTPVSKLAQIMDVFPQKLINVSVASKPDLKTIPKVVSIIESIEKSLGKEGRVLVRYSGTQPMCRVMVEGPSEDLTEQYCREIADVIKENLGD